MQLDDPEHFPVQGKLHTDRLEEKYGLIHAVVIQHDDVGRVPKGTERLRRARLVDDMDILRTYGLTFLAFDENEQALVSIDAEIREGGLLGKTFRTHGYVVKKSVIDVFLMPIPLWLQKDFQVTAQEAKVRLTEFYAKKDGVAPLYYATIVEIYSPDFANPEHGISEFDQAQINPLSSTLLEVGVVVDTIWENLDKAGTDTDWGTVKDQYKQAQQLSLLAIESLRMKVLKHFEEPSIINYPTP